MMSSFLALGSSLVVLMVVIRLWHHCILWAFAGMLWAEQAFTGERIFICVQLCGPHRCCIGVGDGV